MIFDSILTAAFKAITAKGAGQAGPAVGDIGCGQGFVAAGESASAAIVAGIIEANAKWR